MNDVPSASASQSAAALSSGTWWFSACLSACGDVTVIWNRSPSQWPGTRGKVRVYAVVCLALSTVPTCNLLTGPTGVVGLACLSTDAVSSFVQVFAWTCVFISLGQCGGLRCWL